MVQRHVSAYDLFALLVPGATLSGLIVGMVWLFSGMPDLPDSLSFSVLAVGALLAFYLIGHSIENGTESQLMKTEGWQEFRRYIVHGPGTRKYPSKALLAPDSQLGSAFVKSVYWHVNRIFGTEFDANSEADRRQVFQLCSAYLQQHGEAERGFRMQTLFRLGTGLQGVLRLSAWTFVALLAAVFLAALLNWSWPVASVQISAVLLAMAAALVCALLAFRFHEKAQAYDENFVSNILRGFVAVANVGRLGT